MSVRHDFKHHVSTQSYALIISEQYNWNFIFLQSNKYIYFEPDRQLVLLISHEHLVPGLATHH